MFWDSGAELEVWELFFSSSFCPKDIVAGKKMTKTRQQEWEEAVELDKILEDERRQQSSKKLQQANDY